MDRRLEDGDQPNFISKWLTPVTVTDWYKSIGGIVGGSS
jgi:hypothetical protein